MKYNNAVYYLATSTTSNNLARTTKQSEATAFGFIKAEASSGGGSGTGGEHGEFNISWISNQKKVGDNKIYRLDFSPQKGDLGYGACWHPSYKQHQKMADELYPLLKKLLK